MEASAREIRARYYRETAAAIRARAVTAEGAVVRVDLCGLASDYELLADLVQSAPDTSEALDDLRDFLRRAKRA